MKKSIGILSLSSVLSLTSSLSLATEPFPKIDERYLRELTLKDLERFGLNDLSRVEKYDYLVEDTSVSTRMLRTGYISHVPTATLNLEKKQIGLVMDSVIAEFTKDKDSWPEIDKLISSKDGVYLNINVLASSVEVTNTSNVDLKKVIPLSERFKFSLNFALRSITHNRAQIRAINLSLHIKRDPELIFEVSGLVLVKPESLKPPHMIQTQLSEETSAAERTHLENICMLYQLRESRGSFPF